MFTPLRSGAFALAAIALAAGLWVALRDSASSPGDPKSGGKLVVLIVFDQMRGDYPARFAPHFGSDGFERIKKQGVWYSDVHIPYSCTTTGPGHASISTGAPPAVHGIIENDWYDRAKTSPIYCAQPIRPYERVPPAPKGKPSRGSDTGFTAERLLAETVGDRLHIASGKSRVVSLSLKDRCAAMMGGKKPDAAYCFDTRDGLFTTCSYYREAVHPWVEEFNKSGRANEWIGKEWTRSRADLDYEKAVGPDDAAGESTGIAIKDGFNQKRTFPHPFPHKELKEEFPKLYYSAVEVSPAGNELLVELAKKAIVAERLGNGEAADLLCLSFSSNDLIGHAWGPDSQEVLDITLRTDAMMAEFLRFLDEKLGGRYSVVITADHGVCPMPEQNRIAGGSRRSVTEILPPLSLALDDAFGRSPTGLTPWFELELKDNAEMWPWLYLNHKAIQDRKLDPAAVADSAARWIGNRPFMQTAFTRKQIETGELPKNASETDKAMLERVKLAYRGELCGDVIGIPKPGVLVTAYATGTSHASPNEYDTHVPVLAFGTGVPALGRRPEPLSSLIVAPTVSALLGIDSPATAKEKRPFDPIAK